MININANIIGSTSGGGSESIPSSLKNKFLFLGYNSQISAGKMPNTLGTDWLTVTGSVGSETYQCPNTATYIAADADYVWFNYLSINRTTTTSELVSYDFSRTFIKYSDSSPYDVSIIGVLKSSSILTTNELNTLRDYFKLSIWWDNTLSLHGNIKENRAIGRSVFIPDVLASPTSLTSQFVVNTILGQVDWTDNCSGLAQYEVYKSENGDNYRLLITTLAGVVTYNDITCLQNSNVIYKIRAKYSGHYSAYVTATELVTPLCLKTNQSTLTQLLINTLIVTGAGKTVHVDFGDGTSTDYTTGTYTNIAKDYGNIGQYNLVFSGNLANLTYLGILAQVKLYGNISNWYFTQSTLTIDLNFSSCTGTLENWNFDSNNLTLFWSTLTGKTPYRTGHGNVKIYNNSISACNTVVFATNLTKFDFKAQNVSFPTTEIDKFLKAAADWYQLHAPTTNCTFDMTGANMGIPTDGVNNTDKVRLEGYYTTAGKIATVTVRTS